jgi:hypothetical protein
VMDAVYSGDSNNPTSTSGNVDQAVNPVITSTALTSSLNPATYPRAVKFTATVTSKTGGIIPAGVVDFYDGKTFLGAPRLNTSGVTTFTPSTLTAGTHTITAVYSGEGDAAGSPAGPLQGMPSTSNTVTQTINTIRSTTTLASSLNPSTAGQSVTFTATVSNGTKSVPTGTVAFHDGTVTIGTGTLDSTGTATFTTSTLAAGTHQIAAFYSGDVNDNKSHTTALAQVVNP